MYHKPLTTRLLVLFIFWIAIQDVCAQVTFGGTTTELGSGCYQLTGLETFSGGYVYEETPLNLNAPFDLTIPIGLGDNNVGADGIFFVLKADISIFPLIGSSGGSIGFNGAAFSSDALGIEVDTWQNAEFGDPVEDHIGIFRDGLNDHTSTNALAGPIQADPNEPDVEDGEQHNLRIVYDPNIPEIGVYFDCSFRISYTGNLIDSIFNGDTLVHWGVLGTTGGGVNVHTMCMPEPLNALVNDLDEVQLCGVDSFQLNAGAPQIDYLWQPGSGLSDSTIPNPWLFPQDTATYVVRRIFACDTTFDTLFVDANSFAFDLGGDTGICDSTFTLFGPTSGNTFLWNTGDTTPQLTIDQSGVYTLISGNAVCADTDSIEVTLSYVDLPDEINTCDDSIDLAVLRPDDLTSWSTGATTNTITVGTNGAYWATVSNGDCEISDTVDVFFRAVEITRVNDTVLCQDSVVSIAATGATEYLWSTGENTSQIVLNASDSLWVIASNAWCADTDSLSVSIENFRFESPMRVFCDVDAFSETIIAGTDSTVNYAWSTGSTANQITVSQNGIYTVTITSSNCVLTDFVEIQAASTPRFSLGEDLLLCLGEEITITPDTLWSSVAWSTGFIGDSLTVSDTGLYVASMENLGCGFSDSVYVSRFSLPQDPRQLSSNYLTPNQDGINDEVGLETAAPDFISNYRFWIYNRWGNLVFVAQSINHRWDGVLSSGEPASSGVYFFVIEAETKCDDIPMIQLKDNITLIR